MSKFQIRRAKPVDAQALVRLRALMLEAMGQDTTGIDWHRSALRFFEDGLNSPATFAAFVVDDHAAGVVASAVGHVNLHPPGPRDLSAARGSVYNVSTDHAHRRRGYARACVIALLDWFRHDTAVGSIELHATADGDTLYRELGFIETAHPSLYLRL